jgi:hypothetical protein
MQFPKEIEVGTRTPEELLMMMEARKALYRAQRTFSPSNRTPILIGAILILVFGAGAGLLFLYQVAPAHVRHANARVPNGPVSEHH